MTTSNSKISPAPLFQTLGKRGNAGVRYIAGVIVITNQNPPLKNKESILEELLRHDHSGLKTVICLQASSFLVLYCQPGASLRVEDIVDDSIVRELDKSGFIDKVFK